jgi:hypothetical protein
MARQRVTLGRAYARFRLDISFPAGALNPQCGTPPAAAQVHPEPTP